MKHHITKKFILFIHTLVLTVSLAFSQKAELSKEDARFFWKITGTDKNGLPSYVFLQGTIHVGTEDLYPLDSKVMEAFTNADRLAAEIGSEDLKKLGPECLKILLKSHTKNKNCKDFLTQEQLEVLNKILGEKAVNAYSRYEPWFMQMNLENGILLNIIGRKEEYGIDLYLENLAIESGRKVIGLDTLETGLNLLRYGDYEFQKNYLIMQIDSLAGENEEIWVEEFCKMEKMYMEDDTEGMAQLLDSSRKEECSIFPQSAEYNEFVMEKRNENWAAQIKTFLEEGGNTFIFVGAAHLIGENSVFEYLKKYGVL